MFLSDDLARSSTGDPIPNKGQRQYPQMTNIIITENGINKLLQNINIHKASGPDNIHGRILKECTTQIAPILTTLFSLSLKTGKIPDDWRYASVCPAFKKGRTFCSHTIQGNDIVDSFENSRTITKICIY
jgi:hypothetical protein